MENAISPAVEQRQSNRQYRYLRFKLQPGDEALLEQLTDDRRALLTAQGSYKELAERFGMPIGTVRSRLHRARAMFSELRSAQTPEREAPVH